MPGIVRAPVTTTALQVLSRIVLVWGICDQFPSVPANSLFYSSMLIAWSATEVVRYSYFVFSLNGYIPSILSWLRYNMFFVLYPMGISSEMALVYKSIPLAKKRDKRLEWVMYAILGIYFPGRYSLPAKS
jgi:very-long-chain (3R)-3-hydroxyacyl-CoA dehydratase